MGIVNEEVSCEIIQASISVVQREDGESVDPWRFVCLKVDGFERMTPKELRKFGRWCMNEGKRIGQQYRSNGAPRE